MGFRVLGSGSALPARSVTNDELSEFLDTSDEWISQRTGISERRLCTTETLDDLALAASRAALEAAGVTADQLDLVICSTTSGDHLMPAEACAIAELLGASCPAFDVSAACAGLCLRARRGGRLLCPRSRRARARGVGREGQPARGLVRSRDLRPLWATAPPPRSSARAGESPLAVRLTTEPAVDILHVPGLVGTSPYDRTDRPEPRLAMEGAASSSLA